MSTIRKTISISKKDEKLQKVLEEVPSYEVSHVVRQLMYDGLKYRALIEQGLITDLGVNINVKGTYIEENKPKLEQTSYNYEEYEEEIDLNDVEVEEIDEEDEDLEDILLKNS